MSVFSAEVSESSDIGRLCASSWSVDHILKAVGVSKEIGILNLIGLVTVNEGNILSVLVRDLESKSGQHLSEDLWRNLEMSVLIEVLEETLGIESILSHELSELSNDSLHILSLLWSSFSSLVCDLSSCNTNISIVILFKSLLGEDLINVVAELSPFDVFTSLWCSVNFAKLLEFLMGDWNFGHAQSHSELVRSDEARSQSIEISEELSNSDSLLLASLAYSSKHILNINWGVAHNLCLTNSSLSLWEVVKTVVEFLTNFEELLRAVNILTEINIVNLIDVSHIHVSLEKTLKHMLWGEDSKSVENSKELSLGNVAVLGDIEVLENWLEVDSHGLDGLLVLI